MNLPANVETFKPAPGVLALRSKAGEKYKWFDDSPQTKDPSVEAPGELRPLRAPPGFDQEFGVTQDSFYTRYEILQYSPDQLISNKRFDVLERMYQTDDQIQMCVMALKLMRLASGGKIVEASDNPADIEVADFVADALENVQGSFQDMLFNLMGALEIGWSLGEKKYAFYEQGPYAGKVRLDALKSKNPKWFNPAVDDFGNLTKVVSISTPTYGRSYPAEKFIVYSFQKRYENIFGTARTRVLYQWWWIKQVIMRAMGIYMEKYGMPIPIGFYPPNMQQDQRDAFLNVLSALKFQTAITAPDGTKIDFHEVSGKGAQGFLQVIEYADQQITKIILGQTLTTGSGHGRQSGGGGGTAGGGKGGSGASGGMATIQYDIMLMYLEQLGKDLADKPLAELIKDLVDYNYSGIVKYPTFEFNKISQQDLAPSIDAFIAAAGAGLVKPGPDDEERIREILQFPTSQAKSRLRPSKYKNKPVEVTIPKPKPIDPTTLPTASYRLPTPSGPGAPANFAELSSKLFTGTKLRPLTVHEGKMDFSEMLDVLEGACKSIGPKAGKVLHMAVQKLMEEVKRENILGEKSTDKVRRLQIKGKSDLRNIFRDGLRSVAKDAMRAARGELRQAARAHAEAKPQLAHKVFDDIANLTPDEALAFLDDKAFQMAGVTSQDVLERVQAALFNSIKKGQDLKDAMDDVQAALDPYFVEGALDEEKFGGNRLETIVRTNVSEAYNESKKASYLDPDLDGLVVALQYSAILDSRVRPNHAANDGMVRAVTDPVWDERTPPIGYNCRCTLVPVTKFEEYEPSAVPAKGEPDEGF